VDPQQPPGTLPQFRIQPDPERLRAELSELRQDVTRLLATIQEQNRRLAVLEARAGIAAVLDAAEAPGAALQTAPAETISRWTQARIRGNGHAPGED